MEKLKEKSMWVVKIGGSLLGSPELERWLSLFAKHSDGKIIIVPGGSLFADAVRQAQKLSNISDKCAHKLAVLAMDQFGLLLANMCPQLVTASTALEIDERAWQHRGIIWLPSQMVLADESIPENWSVTSDSLAAWLADKLNATQLVLLKCEKPNDSSLDLRLVTESGLVDVAFSHFVLNKTFGSWMLKKSDVEHFLDGVNAEKLDKIGTSIY